MLFELLDPEGDRPIDRKTLEWELEGSGTSLILSNIGYPGSHKTTYSDFGHALRGLGEFLRYKLVQWADFQIWVDGRGQVAYCSLGPVYGGNWTSPKGETLAGFPTITS